MHPQPVVETPRLRPVSEESLDGVKPFTGFGETVRGVLGFGLTRVMNLEPLTLCPARYAPLERSVTMESGERERVYGTNRRPEGTILASGFG
jgi:hypothetical protein